MALISGASLKFIAAFEATPGTELPTPGTAAKQFMLVSESLKATQALGDSMLLSADPNPRRPFHGKKAAAGDLKTYAQVDSVGFMLVATYGGYSKTGTTDIVHVIKPSTTDRYLDLDVEIPFDAASRWKRMNGAVVNSHAFAFGADGAVEMTFGMVGPDVLKKTATFEAAPSDWTDELPYENVMLDAATLEVDGSPYGKLLTLDGTWNWNRYTDDYRAGAAGARGFTPRKRATCKGKCKLALEAVGDWDLVLDQTLVHSFTWKWVISSTVYLKGTLPEVTLSRNDPNYADDNPLFLDLDWTASKDSVSGTSIEWEVGNQIPDYLV